MSHLDRRVKMFEQRRIAGHRMRPSLARKIARLFPSAVVTWFPPKRSWVILLRQKDGTLSYWAAIQGRPTHRNTIEPLAERGPQHFRTDAAIRRDEESMEATKDAYLARQQADANERIREGCDRIAHSMDVGRRYRAQPWRSEPTPGS